jgi:phenylacetaldehyde dehydrogenase
MGPLVSREPLERVCGDTDAGFGEGAKALVGDKCYGDRGYFFEPTVLVDTQLSMQVVREEIFRESLSRCQQCMTIMINTLSYKMYI